MSAIDTYSHTFDVVGVSIRIDCDSFELHELFVKNFERKATVGKTPALRYLVKLIDEQHEVEISRPGSSFHQTAENRGMLIALLEGDLVVQLQLLRADLVFLHAASVSNGKKAHLFTGPSGSGKSTTCWGLLHHGFRYLSDELAPVSLATTSVSPYLHALCLKSAPPADYPCPEEAILTQRGIHVPSSALPASPIERDMPIGSIFFVEYQRANARASIERVQHGEAAARLYPNILNALAHGNDGLEAALQITRGVDCYRVDAADLADTCELIAGVAER